VPTPQKGLLLFYPKMINALKGLQAAGGLMTTGGVLRQQPDHLPEGNDRL